MGERDTGKTGAGLLQDRRRLSWWEMLSGAVNQVAGCTNEQSYSPYSS